MKPMKPWMLATLLIQALFFTAWGVSETWKLKRGLSAHGEFLLETLPIDPRSLISGHYMSLRLKASDATSLLPYGSNPTLDAALLLEPVSSIDLNGKKLSIYDAVQAERPAPKPLPLTGPGQIWVLAKSGQSFNLIFGIERYYFSEERMEEMNAMPSGKSYARVTVAPDGSLKLLGLERK